MTLRFTRKQLITLLFVIILIIGSISLLYYLKVEPIKTANKQLQNDLKIEEKLFEVVVEKRKTMDKPVISSTEIQKKIPVIPLVEQLILDLERAETVSGSIISDMTFSENDTSIAATSETNEENSNSDSATENTNVGSSDKTKQPINNDPTLANSLKQIVITLNVEAPSYYELEKFISTIEHQTRITKVNTLSFTGRPELFSLNQESSPLIFNVTISTFYMPELVELEGDTPKIEIPDPSNKKNPLAVGLDDIKDGE
ncbi:hypothetical protein [Fredinandcohnia quinoae]|uniref:Pilus assembly protein PilO n=1 Tax=Fredinandcohnia quinoae TaxID=2918902 RepID=A0AAW5E0X5_9BACI|nr:hypothetical protein [Fredinandcohnia sp. SECRCQ15]MCH1626567.1 hypothetical protein [Fredinandcohnia sp. SECRCQ15]